MRFRIAHIRIPHIMTEKVNIAVVFSQDYVSLGGKLTLLLSNSPFIQFFSDYDGNFAFI